MIYAAFFVKNLTYQEWLDLKADYSIKINKYFAPNSTKNICL